MNKILIWFTQKYLDGVYWANPLCKFKFYRYVRGGEWVYIDWHWLRMSKAGKLKDIQGRVYTISIPPSCIREYYRVKRT